MRSIAPSRLAVAARRVAVAACLAGVAAGSQAGVLDFLFGSSKESTQPNRSADSRRRTWPISEFSGVRVVPAEAGAAANEQPAQLPANVLRDLLSEVRISAGPGAGDPLFARDELDDLVAALSEAMQVAGPRDDVLLVSSSRRNGGLLSVPMAVTARLFVTGSQLNLIVHDTRYDFFGLYRGANKQPEFVYGSRSGAGKATIERPNAVRRRADWLEIPVASVAPRVVPTPATLSAAPAAAPAAPAAAARAMPPVESAPAARPRDPAFFEEQEQRLATLKRLRDRGLITEEEYQQKRAEVLKLL